MKHEAELVPAEVIPSPIIKEVVFTADPKLNKLIDENAKSRERFARLEEAERIHHIQLRARRERERERCLNTGNDYCDCSPSRAGMMHRT